MAGIERAGKLRVRTASGWVDAEEWVRTASGWVRVDPDVPVEQVGMIMSRGPYGSRWGPDALGDDGGLPAMKTPTYGTTSGTSFTPRAEAADFRFLLGVNHHLHMSVAWSSNHAAAIAAVQALGVFHVRGTVAYMPNTWFVTGDQQRSQAWFVACKNANASRAGGVMPILNTFNGPNERGYYDSPEYMQNVINNGWSHPDKYHYWIFNEDRPEGDTIFRPIEGPPALIGAHQYSFGGYFLGRDGTTTDDEGMGWDWISMITGPNEPGHRSPQLGARYTVANFGIHWEAREMKAHRDHPANRDQQAVEAGQWIDSSTGRIGTAAATLAQVPIIPVCHITPEARWSQATGTDPTGDFTDRLSGEYMDSHNYMNAHGPLWDYEWGAPDSSYPGGYGYQAEAGNYGLKPAAYGRRHAVNGSWNSQDPGVKFTKHSIPMTATEIGHVTQFDGRFAFPVPEDICGEFLITQILQHYMQGYKRVVLYALNDEGSEGGGQLGWGLVKTDYTVKAHYKAIQNLMAAVPFSEGPEDGLLESVSIPHSYTPGGPFTLSGYPGFYTGTKPTYGGVQGDDFSRDICMKLLLRVSATSWRLFLSRPIHLWARREFVNEAVPNTDTARTDDYWYPGHAKHPTLNNGIVSCDPRYRRSLADEGGARNATVHLPAGWTCQGVREPAKSSLTPSPTTPIRGVTSIDGLQYANMNNGQTTAPLNDGSAMQVTQSGQNIIAPVGGLTRVLYLTSP